MSNQPNIKNLINDQFNLSLTNRVFNIFLSEYQNSDESISATKQRVIQNPEAFVEFIKTKPETAQTIKGDNELMSLYLDEIDFLGKAIVSLKNYSAISPKIKDAIPDMLEIYKDYEYKIQELKKKLNLDESFASKRIKKYH